MNATICRVCGEKNLKILFQGRLLERNVNYYECQVCDYVQTQTPDWLEEAYNSPINLTDTGIVLRNQSSIYRVISTLKLLKKVQGKVLDFAGGYGLLVRMLRDLGIDAYWMDPYCKNLLSKGFEHTNQKIDLVTAFEVLEHLVYPMQELDTIFRVSPNALFSTTLIPLPAPALKEWDYYGLEHGQHTGFYRMKTLEYIAQKYGKHLVTDGIHYHLFTQKRVNKSLWILFTKLAKHIPKALLYNLSSKTQRDHELLKHKTINK